MNPRDIAVYILPDSRLRRDDMLISTAAAYTGMDKDLFVKETDERGKPYFRGLEGIHFSISHSGDYWACAFSSQKVGLDLQKHEQCKYKNIANRFFHKDENDYLESKGYEPTAFFMIWVQKESFVKLLGRGMDLGFETFSVFDGEKKYESRLLPFLEGYSVCVSAEKLGEVSLRIITQ